jgi:hypothetical protein
MFLATLGMKETTVLKWIKQDGNLEETIEIHEEATENKNSKVRNLSFLACQNATIFLAGVGGPSDPTIARGNITSLLKHLELAEKAQETEMTTSHADATRPLSVTFFGTFILKSFSLFVCFSFQFFFVYRFTFGFLLLHLLWKLCQPFGAAGTTRVGPKI